MHENVAKIHYESIGYKNSTVRPPFPLNTVTYGQKCCMAHESGLLERTVQLDTEGRILGLSPGVVGYARKPLIRRVLE